MQEKNVTQSNKKKKKLRKYDHFDFCMMIFFFEKPIKISKKFGDV